MHTVWGIVRGLGDWRVGGFEGLRVISDSLLEIGILTDWGSEALIFKNGRLRDWGLRYSEIWMLGDWELEGLRV